MSFEQNTASVAPKGYTDFLMEVKTQIRQRQLQALRAVNSELLAGRKHHQKTKRTRLGQGRG